MILHYYIECYYVLHYVEDYLYFYILPNVMYRTEKYVTMKISEVDHEKLRKIKHEFFVESYAEAVSKLIEEHEKAHCVGAPA